ncbi:hypothetical protein N7450_010463 [Penicillium hetheringtonii]|uniref:ASST-domain-containing protein n=1 Tax=Penicillium hetheringtonii TaxID=911720 RepID=A0AAD6D9U9_9EURO|nr:hypothetical protein N7450_010463 [Penicillium hetheringtonii]
MLALTLLLLSLLSVTIAQSDSEGFQSYITLPDVWAPRFNIKNHSPERVSPGYWFVAPYGRVLPKNPVTGAQVFHTGPYIFDQDGTLIWAGSSMFKNLNAYDFKAVRLGDQSPRLSLILAPSEDAPRGRAVVLNERYETEFEVSGAEDFEVFDIHEFKILPGGKTALACAHWTKEITLEDLGRPKEQSFFEAAGFYEFDIASGQRLFWWDSSAPGNIALHESVILDNSTMSEESPGHDYVHINSVDKNDNGDYLASMRFTNTIYLISGKDGSIKWRLGGHETSFDQDFTFSKQHDARFLESNETHHIISFLNNASDDRGEFRELFPPKTAKVIHRYNRPDNKLSRLRGSAQKLPNGNVFVSWSDNGYMSEFSSEGDNLMETQFMTTGFYNYRAYKYEIAGRPGYPPVVVASATGSEENDQSTTIYFSWNGATDITSWNLYAQDRENQQPYLMANIKKTGFETVHIAKGHIDWVFVEALDQQGTPLGRSGVSRTQWDTAGTEEKDPQSEIVSGIESPNDQTQPKNNFMIFSSFVSLLGFLPNASIIMGSDPFFFQELGLGLGV